MRCDLPQILEWSDALPMFIATVEYNFSSLARQASVLTWAQLSVRQPLCCAMHGVQIRRVYVNVYNNNDVA